jgi:hypothetical protein
VPAAPALALILLAAAGVQAHAQTLSVVSTSPALNTHNAPRNTPVSVTFDRPVNTATVTTASVSLFGKLVGPMAGTITFSNGDRTVTITPTRVLGAGETALLVLSNALRGADGSAIRPGGYTLMFAARSAPSPRVFQQVATISNRDPGGAQTRIYGGLACDLNRDGWSDMALVNEVSADLRVFLNRADGSGLYLPMLMPPLAIPRESSPNEVADFDGDGFIDIVVSSASDNQIAVAFGRGDGSFRTPALEINVPGVPRGFGILDLDGDGDMDITVACAGGNTIAVIRNTGGGTFAAPFNVEGGVNGEYGMTAADMNNDGLLDLVVAGVNSRTVNVLLNNGAGGFTPQTARPVGGSNWVIVCGDLNNDGNMDVSAANSFSSNGSTLLGNGDGSLQPAVVQPVGGHAVSTDLADLDGDGDLDWILSSFGAGRWYIFVNDGTGVFTDDFTVPAPANPSCAVPVDLDNDSDIDIVLTDEIADVMVIMHNTNPCRADWNADGTIDFNDLLAFLNDYNTSDPRADVNRDGAVDFNDLLEFLNLYNTPC